jgi:hypothetical protein
MEWTQKMYLIMVAALLMGCALTIAAIGKICGISGLPPVESLLVYTICMVVIATVAMFFSSLEGWQR